jgi:hypothetical protein
MFNLISGQHCFLQMLGSFLFLWLGIISFNKLIKLQSHLVSGILVLSPLTPSWLFKT